jgi:FkbM family methyltransferase
MNTDDTTNALDLAAFTAALDAARERGALRILALQDLVARKSLALFGYGGKGRFLAQHIRQHVRADIAVYDSASEKRALAAERGFQTIDSLEELAQAPWATILGACQAQAEQRRSIPKDYLYFQEAACLFEAPHLAHLASDFGAYVADEGPALHSVYLSLHPTSRSRFLDVLRFRLSSDPTDLAPTRASNTEMWLDIPTQHRRRPYQAVLDVGAFDGDTLLSFRQRFASERGIAVEANPQLFDLIRGVAQSYPQGIEILPRAAWSRRTRLKFEEGCFGMIQVMESTEGTLEAAPIDTMVTERVDFLKMDIEGAEAQALAGSDAVLRRWQPDLAIAAYHRPDDLVSLHQQIASFGYCEPGFALHFGHYSDCLDDSIFYVCRTE